MYQAHDGRLIEVTTIGELPLKQPKWPFNRGLSSHSFLQLFRDFDYWPLNRGWPLNGGSTVIIVSRENTAEKVFPECSHLRISSINSKVRTAEIL